LTLEVAGARRRKTKTMGTKDANRSPRVKVWSLVGLATCLFLWAAMLTFNAGDWPSAHQFPHNTPAGNGCGLAGAWCAYQLRHLLGDGAHPLVLFATLAAVLKIARGQIGFFAERVFGLALVVTCTSASAHLICGPGSGTLPAGHGGLVGYALGQLLTDNLSRFGTIIVLVSSWTVGLVFTTQGWVLRIPTFVGQAAQASQAWRAAVRAASPVPVAVEQAVIAPPRGVVSAETASPVVRRSGKPLREATTPVQADEPPKSKEPKQPLLPLGEFVAEPVSTPGSEKKVERAQSAQVKTGSVVPRPSPTLPPQSPVVNFPTPQQAAAADPYPRQIENWRLPSIELLREPEYGFNEQQEIVVRRQAKVLEDTLEEFRIEARVVEIDTGPVITMFELRLGAGIKVSQIATLSNDIARALKAHAIRVVAPISGKNTVGIEVPNIDKERVRLKELMTLAGKKASEMELPLFLGKDAGGAALVADLTTMPHMLIAGTTGSGKSVCLNAIILSVLMTKRPDHVKLILIDPKMVEMSQFKEVPHLMCPLVTDMARAEKILEWAVTQMDERYELLAEARVKNVAGYNALTPEEIYDRFKPASEQEKSRIPTRLPYIVIVIDELADLMMTAAKEVEHHLSRLAQKSRAVGVHIMVATQRPEVKVVTGLIKSNLPARICFRVASRMDSRIVMDQNGGEVLMGQGDMLFLPPGSHKLMRAQGTYLEEDEVRAVLDDLATRAKPDFHPELMRLKTNDAEVDEGLRDPLFDEAVRIVLETKRGSVSLLQRRLNVGYSRASRLIDQMALAGIVGDYKGSQAREVVITLDQWDAIRAQRDAEEAAQADTEARPVAAADRWYDSEDEDNSQLSREYG
jgi:S-DNA-T family DNA segregation ATPase FtsK/SpoIIIE